MASTDHPINKILTSQGMKIRTFAEELEISESLLHYHMKHDSFPDELYKKILALLAKKGRKLLSFVKTHPDHTK